MSEELWISVDQYLADVIIQPDASLDAALSSSTEAGLPAINVSPALGKLLMIVARLRGARRILEIGTLGGYSAIWMSRGLAPGGKLTSLEIDPKHADVARRNLERAGVSQLVDIRVGPALETLPRLSEAKSGPYDLVFIDADKQSNADYFAWAVRLTEPGAVIIVDNVIRKGQVIDANSEDTAVQGARRLNQAMAKERGVVVTELQTVGVKGYDGIAIALRV
jgi:predicted O-methyltransferase YrrM